MPGSGGAKEIGKPRTLGGERYAVLSRGTFVPKSSQAKADNAPNKPLIAGICARNEAYGVDNPHDEHIKGGHGKHIYLTDYESPDTPGGDQQQRDIDREPNEAAVK
jgi:hypothetical protein